MEEGKMLGQKRIIRLRELGEEKMEQIKNLKRESDKILGWNTALMILAGFIISLFVAASTNFRASATSAVITTSKSGVAVGEEFKVTVRVTDVASWNIHVWPSGPVEGCVIDSANVSEEATNLPEKVFEASCVATDEGSVVLTLFGEVADEAENEISLSATAAVSAAFQTEPSATEPEKNPETEPQPAGTTPETPEPEPTGGSQETATINAEPQNAVAETVVETTESEETDTEAEKTDEEKATDEEADKEEVLAVSEEKTPGRTIVVASGSTSDDRVKSALVVALAVIATMVGCIEVYIILSSHRKERLQNLREKAQALQVATTTMRLAQAMEKK